MDQVLALLQNPVIRQGLKVASPQLALGIDVIASSISLLFGKRKKPGADVLLAKMDTILAEKIKELATTESKFRQKELEIRIHQILEILYAWEKCNT